MEGWKHRLHVSVDFKSTKQLVLHLLDFYFSTSRALLISLEFPSFGRLSIRETKENGFSKPLALHPHSKNGLNTARDSAFHGWLFTLPPLPPPSRIRENN